MTALAPGRRFGWADPSVASRSCPNEVGRGHAPASRQQSDGWRESGGLSVKRRRLGARVLPRACCVDAAGRSVTAVLYRGRALLSPRMSSVPCILRAFFTRIHTTAHRAPNRGTQTTPQPQFRHRPYSTETRARESVYERWSCCCRQPTTGGVDYMYVARRGPPGAARAAPWRRWRRRARRRRGARPQLCASS